MNDRAQVMQALAALLAYPQEGFAASTEAAAERLERELPGAREMLQPFLDFAWTHTVEELQENYTSTFEVNPRCCMEIGWQVYGESYSRGSFLVWMRSVLRDLGLPESPELPDHLLHALPILGAMRAEDAAELATAMVAPAVRKMAVGLASNSDAYEAVLDLVLTALEDLAAGMPEIATEEAVS
ncbi:MAG TPA: molecular chaperone TorD family protein [Planctomycetota bacterium]